MAFWRRKKKIYFIPLLIVIAIISLLTIFGDRGLVRIYKLSKERDSIKTYNEKIKEENTAMRDEIKRLKTDDKYIETIARKELGMVGKNELVYQFEK
ncbi:MAG: septum formation initiator family protein [Deltaproteobacteria bacterium]